MQKFVFPKIKGTPKWMVPLFLETSICYHLLKKKMAAFFFGSTKTKGGAVDCAAVESRRPNQPANHQGGRKRVENHVGSQQGRCQWSPAVILAGSHSISVATGRTRAKSWGICAKDP